MFHYFYWLLYFQFLIQAMFVLHLHLFSCDASYDDAYDEFSHDGASPPSIYRDDAFYEFSIRFHFHLNQVKAKILLLASAPLRPTNVQTQYWSLDNLIWFALTIYFECFLRTNLNLPQLSYDGQFGRRSMIC